MSKQYPAKNSLSLVKIKKTSLSNSNQIKCPQVQELALVQKPSKALPWASIILEHNNYKNALIRYKLYQKRNMHPHIVAYSENTFICFYMIYLISMRCKLDDHNLKASQHFHILPL